MSNFKNFVPDIFKSAEEKERRALAKIEQARTTRENARGVALRFAALRDALEAAKEHYSGRCRDIDAWLQPPTLEQCAASFLGGSGLLVIGNAMAARSAVEVQIEDFKAAIYRQIVTPAENALAVFTKANKVVIAKLPQLQHAPEPEFVPGGPSNEWSDFVPAGPPSDGVRLMLNLKPGQLVPPPAWETAAPKRTGIEIRDLDED